jgi:hypothetical protein
MEIVVVPKKTGQYLTLVLVGILFFLAGGFFYFFNHNLVFAGVGFSLGVLIPLALWPREDAHGVVLTVNNEGIFDRRLGVGVIEWKDVEDAQIQVRYNNRFICLKVRSPEKYLARLAGPKQQNVLRNRDLGFNTFNISVNNVNVNLLELLDFIKKRSSQLR